MRRSIPTRQRKRAAPRTRRRRDTGRTGTRPPYAPAYLRWGTWIGGDRDGNPNVTADITARSARIQADHVLRGYENVALRLMGSVAAYVRDDTLDRAVRRRLAGDDEELADAMRSIDRRFPAEPYRRRLGAMAERLRRTRAGLVGTPAPLTGRYESADAFVTEIAELQSALAADGLGRVAYGELQDLRWQAETFGFHLASLEVRQHSAVHAAALEALRGGRPLDDELPVGRVTAAEVIATFRAVAAIQARFGEAACHHYVISFTRIGRRRPRRPRSGSIRWIGCVSGDGDLRVRARDAAARCRAPARVRRRARRSCKPAARAPRR